MTAFIFFLYGLIIGSFLSVCIYRLPKKESIAFPRSRCPRCLQPIRWYDNLPLVSYLLLRGRCRFCKNPISPLYPLVEGLNGALFTLLYLKYSLTPQLFIYLLLASGLLVLIFIDLRHRLLPNYLTLPGIGLGFLLSFVNPRVEWWDSLVGIALGGGLLLLVGTMYYWLRKVEGMGMGDVKLMAMVGAFVGWKLTLLTIVLGSLLGSVVGVSLIIKRGGDLKTALPFGTFLGSAALGSLLFGQEIINSYLTLIRGAIF
ncbi:prepilin peptidase [bacterium (candidate division B38) B3_B38]|nr:MAG: prepilin peptidase [bacterium (candidate division B38) B3_B38]